MALSLTVGVVRAVVERLNETKSERNQGSSAPGLQHPHSNLQDQSWAQNNAQSLGGTCISPSPPPHTAIGSPPPYRPEASWRDRKWERRAEKQARKAERHWNRGLRRGYVVPGSAHEENIVRSPASVSIDSSIAPSSANQSCNHAPGSTATTTSRSAPTGRQNELPPPPAYAEVDPRAGENGINGQAKGGRV